LFIKSVCNREMSVLLNDSRELNPSYEQLLSIRRVKLPIAPVVDYLSKTASLLFRRNLQHPKLLLQQQQQQLCQFSVTFLSSSPLIIISSSSFSWELAFSIQELFSEPSCNSCLLESSWLSEEAVLCMGSSLADDSRSL